MMLMTPSVGLCCAFPGKTVEIVGLLERGACGLEVALLAARMPRQP